LSLSLTFIPSHMAPLDRFTYTPLPSEAYVTFHNNDWGKDYYILSRRDVIVGTHPLYEFETPPSSPSSTSSSQAHSQATSFHALLDLFTENLCLCPHHQQRMTARPQRASSVSNAVNTSLVHTSSQYRKNILYPVARYPDRLNNPELVQQRRKSLRSCSTFVPVVVE
jgi:hypothetical protein